MKRIIILALLTAMLTIGCSTKQIKGTDFEDTPENREVLEVFKNYIMAIKKQEYDKILELVSEEYYDNNGTDEADDDADYEGIKALLDSDEFKEIGRIEVAAYLKDLKVEGNSATVFFYYDTRFKSEVGDDEEFKESILKPKKETWRKITDIINLQLKKENGDWKIVSGI